jgi:hypothetical protein
MSEQIKWEREVPLMTNYYLVMDVLFVILFGGAGISFMLYLVMGAGEIYVILEIVTIAIGALIVLAYMVMGVFMMNNVEMRFTINEKGIQIVLGNKENRINRIALFFGSITGKLSLMGTSALAMSREQTFVEWSSIQKAVLDERKKVINLSTGKKMLVRLYCSPEVYPEAVMYVEKMLPDVEPKYI